MYIYCIYIDVYRSVCPLVVKLYAIYEGVTFENLRKYSVLNGNFVFDLVTFTGTRNRGIKLDLPLLYAPS
jgi:ABC-type arginine/histidine transport system permease subunit